MIFQLPTPSLGITYRGSATGGGNDPSFQLPLSGSPDTSGSSGSVRGSFQLPLSGSHDFRDRTNRHRTIARRFQLPLSGSHVRDKVALSRAPLAPFNSLSRDHYRRGSTRSSATVRSNFQLPLSGSPFALTIPIFIRRNSRFQLPLSGSPSPIPGFFGSPRLSAAAPLRTNDF